MGIAIAFVGVAVIVGLVLFVDWFFALFGRNLLPDPRTPADELHRLEQRFARGQVDDEQFRHWQALLLDDERRGRDRVPTAARGGRR